MTQFEAAAPHPKAPSLLANTYFLILWLGQMVSQLGNAFFNFAMVIWIVRTAGAPALGGIMMVAAIPGIVLGPVAGTLVDSMDRKKIIVYSDLVRGAIMLLAAWMMWEQTFQLLHIYAVLIIFNCIQPLFSSSVSAVLPNLVEDEQLGQANSMRQSAASGTNLIGPALAVLILSALGGIDTAIPLFFLLNGISYILSGISEMFLSIPPLVREKAANNKEAMRVFAGQLAEGFTYVWNSSMITRLLLILGALNFFLAPLGQVVIPGVVIDVLAMDEMWLGFIQSGIAAGFLAASVVLSILRQSSLSRLVIIGTLSMGLSVVLMGFSMAAPIYLQVSLGLIAAALVVLSITMGSSAAMANIALSTIMQKVVPNEKRGRVFAFMNTFLGGMMPLSLGVAGMLATLVPLFVQPVIGGVAVLGAGMMLRRVREFRQY